ncbi:MAG: hypothetical protein JSW60_08025 [Thermoplasmatales archaeon]|nr:MAG: hypothetical protein JSW60_08025 [Thermoplasmatales archaeon]
MPAGIIDPESERVGNSALLFSLSFLIFLIALTLTINDSFWIGIIAFCCSSVLSLGYYIRSTLKSAKQEKKFPNIQPPVDAGVV